MIEGIGTAITVAAGLAVGGFSCDMGAGWTVTYDQGRESCRLGTLRGRMVDGRCEVPGADERAAWLEGARLHVVESAGGEPLVGICRAL